MTFELLWEKLHFSPFLDNCCGPFCSNCRTLLHHERENVIGLCLWTGAKIPCPVGVCSSFLKFVNHFILYLLPLFSYNELNVNSFWSLFISLEHNIFLRSIEIFCFFLRWSKESFYPIMQQKLLILHILFTKYEHYVTNNVNVLMLESKKKKIKAQYLGASWLRPFLLHPTPTTKQKKLKNMLRKRKRSFQSLDHWVGL